MAELVVTFPGGKKVNAEYHGNVLKTDQTTENGGEGSAPEPFTLFLASIGTCAGIYVLGFCQARKIDATGVRLTQKMEWDEATHVLKKVWIEIHVPPSFPAKYHDALVRSADGCAVKKAIQAQPVFDVRTVVDGEVAKAG
ncbi:MAG TPA: OsmC family protein [Myxococcales bacterium]|jgi:ribosomal protein S12 methylthiotransferase accessory factor